MTARLRYSVRTGSGVAIYRQVVEQVRAMVGGGRLRPGDLLPSVRDAALDLGVNPMTVSKAYTQLEQEGIVERVRGTGMRVASPGGRPSVAQRQGELRELAETLVTRAHQLGLTDEQAQAVLRRALKENKQPR